ncbi:hypothetical protein SO802_022873 [Lithocarpus litseifolius]|uniref:Uncharacterized protein n=1 Tax=Lithocarpus litseifolius TaxID=425828 RepID=A0AAW2C4I8_9ROSI
MVLNGRTLTVLVVVSLWLLLSCGLTFGVQSDIDCLKVSLANCTYLNVLKLDHNRLTGHIPLELGLLARLKQFSVANNLLTGPVPYFGQNSSFTADSFANNPGLCGLPLDPCPSASKKSHTTVIAAAAVGGVTVAA